MRFLVENSGKIAHWRQPACEQRRIERWSCLSRSCCSQFCLRGSCCVVLPFCVWSDHVLHYMCPQKCFPDSFNCYEQPNLRTIYCLWQIPATYVCMWSYCFSFRRVQYPLGLITCISIGISPSLLWVFTVKSKSPRPRWASKQWWAMVTIHGFSISKRWMMTLTPLILKSLGESLLLPWLSLHLLRTSRHHESLYVRILWNCHFLQQLLLRTCYCHSALMIWFCNLAYWISRVVHLTRAHGISNYGQNCLTRTWK